MSRGAGDRKARATRLYADAVFARGASDSNAVAGIPSAARSRFAGPSGDAPGRPHRAAMGCDRRMAPEADNGRASLMTGFPEAEL
jgi:hypothetical protein